MEIIISNTKCYIDDCDFELFSKYRWSAHEKRYVKTTNNYVGYYKNKNGKICKKQKSIFLHRLILNAEKGQIVDHINGNRLDNRRCNLRITDYFGNARNRAGDFCKKSKLPKGVYFSGKPNKIYRVRLQTKIKRFECGHFSCIAAAVLKYNELARKHFGEFARASR
jgi:hypothetical protein